MNDFKIGFAAFQDGTFDLFIRNEYSGTEWFHQGTWNEKTIDELNETFYSCVMVKADAIDLESVKPKLYDDTDPVMAALSMLFRDKYATDNQRRTAKIAMDEIEELRGNIAGLMLK